MPTSKPEKKEPKKPLSVTHSELAKEADGWDPKSLVAGSGKKKKWRCLKGHTYEARIADRTGKDRTGCPYCYGRIPVVGENDLGTTHPELARELVDEDARHFSAGSGKKVKWKCGLGHSWTAVIGQRVKGSGCPYCAGKKVLAGFNDLTTTHPDIASQAYGWDPRTLNFGSNKIVDWICPQGHNWKTSVSGRSNNRGCPVCIGKKILAGFNDLATKFPEIATQAENWDPTKISPGSIRILQWRCNQGHIWSASTASRTGVNKTGCPYCSGNKVLVGFNDFATTHPDVAEQAIGWDPTTVSAGANQKRKWKCAYGHIYESRVAERTGEHRTDCPYCSGTKVLVGFNDLLTTHTELSKELIDGDPKSISRGSGQKFTWQCNLGHTWKAQVADRTKGYGCPSCAISGYDPNKDGFLYFITHPDWEKFQIGITNAPDDRLKVHQRLGWEVLEIRGPMDGHLTKQWETAILRMLKKKGADLSNEKIAGKFDGYSEAWTIATFPVDSIKELMRLTDEFEENLGKG